MTQPYWGRHPAPPQQPPAQPEEQLHASVPTNSDFLRHLAAGARKGTALWVHAFDGNPDGHQGWGGFNYNAAINAGEVDSWGSKNTYFSVASLRPDVHGELARRKANFDRLLCLVADDVEPEDLMARPSYVLRTSPGKCQVGFFIESGDTDAADMALATRLVTTMATRGMVKADKSGNNVVRWVRLPVGTNQKPRDTGPWQHRLELWEPGNRYSLDEAAHCLGINLDELRAEAREAQAPTGIAEGPQEDRLRQLTTNVLRGENLHDSINAVAASMVSSGMAGGAIVNMLRALMDASLAARDERWLARYQDIPRAVTTAQEKFRYEQRSVAAEAAQTGDKPRMFIRAADLLANLKPIEWLVKGILETDALSMLFGPSGAGKSFVAVDFACCVSTGTAWLGHSVRQAPVFYVAGEGHSGLARRLAAWQKDRNVSLATADLYKSERAVLLLDKGAAEALADEIAGMVDQGMPVPGLVVVDTLARNFGDGDENTAADASRFIENVDTLIRKRWKCNVLIVHHSGHTAERARGSSAFKAAMDQELSVTPKGPGLILEVTKMKDAERPAGKALTLKTVEVGEDQETGEPIESAVLETVGDPFDFVVAKKAGGHIKAREVVDMLLEPQGWAGFPWMCTRLGCANATAQRIVKELLNQQILERHGDGNKASYVVTASAKQKLSLIGGLLKAPSEDDE